VPGEEGAEKRPNGRGTGSIRRAGSRLEEPEKPDKIRVDNDREMV
jgi:hypothetical protein